MAPRADSLDVSLLPPDSFSAALFRYQGSDHAYKIYVPPRVTRRASLRLVVMLHGCGQDADDFAAGTGMNQAAKHTNTVVLYPAQSESANSHRCWNWYLPEHQERGHGEPAWIAALTRSVVRALGITPGQTFVAGLSAGGAMAATVSRAYPELYAGCGVHSGLAAGAARGVIDALSTMRNGFKPVWRADARHVPTIAFHGDEDDRVHPRHSDHLVAAALAARRARGRSNRHDAAADEHRVDPATDGARAHTRYIHRDGQGRVLAERWIIHGAGHAWAGGNAEGSHTDPQGPDASAEMLRFFGAINPPPLSLMRSLVRTLASTVAQRRLAA